MKFVRLFAFFYFQKKYTLICVDSLKSEVYILPGRVKLLLVFVIQNSFDTSYMLIGPFRVIADPEGKLVFVVFMSFWNWLA